MNRVKKTILNVIAIVILSFISLSFLGLHLTPLSAHRVSERSIHYGPSEIVHIENFSGGKYILGKYDKWISFNTVNRVGLLFWRFGNQVTGIENDTSNPLNYTYGMDQEKYKLYGIINDPEIKRIEIILKSGEIVNVTNFYDDMFLVLWGKGLSTDFDKMKAYDSDNNLLVESSHPGEYIIFPIP